MKLPIVHLIRYGKVILATTMILISIAIGWFLYQDGYRPLTQAIMLAELKTRVSLVAVNKAKLNKVIKKIEESKAPLDIDWASIKNPFAEKFSETTEGSTE